MTMLSEEIPIKIEDSLKSIDSIKMEDKVETNVSVKTEEETIESKDLIKLEENTIESKNLLKMESDAFESKFEIKTENSAIETKNLVELESNLVSSNNVIKMEDEMKSSNFSIKTKDKPTDIDFKMEDDASNADFKKEETVELFSIKTEPDFVVSKTEIKINPDEIDFMFDLKDSEPSDIEFSEESDSSSDIEINIGDKEFKVDAFEIEDLDFEVSDLLPKSTLNELDDKNIEKILADRKLPTHIDSQGRIVSLGKVLTIAGPYSIVIESNPQQNKRKTQVLDEDTILVLEDRSVIGIIFETFGPVARPLYLVRFPKPIIKKENSPSVEIELETESNMDDSENVPSVVPQPLLETPEAPSKKFVVGQEIFYAQDAARIVPVTEIIKMKGTDASNQNDEEVDSDEMDFSDDDKEQEHKLRKKSKFRSTKHKKVVNVPTTTSNPRKRHRSRPKKGIIDEDNPNNTGLAMGQGEERSISRHTEDDYTRLLMSYEDL